MSSRGDGAQGLLTPSKAMLKAEQAARESHLWAVERVAARFREGLSHVLDGVFVGSRFGEFLIRSDPVYVTLLQGMQDEAAARALIGNWMVAHTLATQTRFWLEQAIIDILMDRAGQQEEPRPEIYSLQMLADGWHTSGKSLWHVGERWREELHGRGAWRPLIQEKALDEIERIAGEEERRYESIRPGERRAEIGHGALSQNDDERSLSRAAHALGGAARPIAVRCNLLVVEPERPGREPQTWAIRYINPTTFGQASIIKAERVNLLRLRAYLAQEKPFRAPGKVVVAIADILPRPNREEGRGRIASYFSPLTRWDADQFWSFLKVPFAAVTAGIRDAGEAMRDQLVSAATQLLQHRDHPRP